MISTRPLVPLAFAATLLAIGAPLDAAPDTRPAAKDGHLPRVPAGGANSPPPTAPPAFALDLRELSCGDFAVRVPCGERSFRPGEAPRGPVPGPIAAFRGPDGIWRGHGYLETWRPLRGFRGSVEGPRAHLLWEFSEDRRYEVRLEAKDGVLLLDEEARMGPRDLWVLDAFPGWQPTCGFVLDEEARKHAFLWLPCFYDEPEAALAIEGRGARALAVLHPSPEHRDVAALWLRGDLGAGEAPDARMGIELWQRRQRPGDPESRHFLGPETKSDTTPNPRTRDLLGRSLYEGHVTFELRIAAGRRRLAFAVAPKGSPRARLAEPIARRVREHLAAAPREAPPRSRTGPASPEPWSRTFSIADHFGVGYSGEPVSVDVDLPAPTPVGTISLEPGPWQVEVLDGTPEAARRVRVWTLVDLPGGKTPGAERQRLLTVHVGEARVPRAPTLSVEPVPHEGPVPLAMVSGPHFRAVLPAGDVRPTEPVSGFRVPGPVVRVSRDGRQWVGDGYLQARRRVEEVRVRATTGPVYHESDIGYRFEGGRRYRARVRIYATKPYALLVEDFDVGGAARFVFDYGEWPAEEFFRPRDQHLAGWESVSASHPCGDFVRLPGQTCLARLVVWSQFNYFAGKQETIALRSARTAVGGFLVRPDRWTRAKVNHVDLWLRPQAPEDPETRGVVGWPGARPRPAMEAWITEGHREWALFAVASDDDAWLAKAHVREGIWPLDRLGRLPLVWNSDGSEVSPEAARPGDELAGGYARQVLVATGGRSGLQVFNGSNGHIRRFPNSSGWDGRVDRVRAGPESNSRLAGQAISAYMAADESAYPGLRAMLPWTDPEALNPFYQGMENMNFNADLYRHVAGLAVPLLRGGHPEAERFIDHAETSLDRALDRYVYPRSGCWEESHGYAQHTLKVVGPLAEFLREAGRRDFLEDPRLASMVSFFIAVLSPVDRAFGRRVVPPVGDHGLKRQNGPARVFGPWIRLLREARSPEVRRIVEEAAWLVREDGGEVEAGIEPRRPSMESRWLQGYGSVMRAPTGCRVPAGPEGKEAPEESFLVLRAGQSWGHHHEDKGSMWFWGRGVHFFGDADWGAPPGGTYWNRYKQGPASGTQIELVGVNNWTLPCKFPAPWIEEDEYAEEYDYACARCLYPYNPRLDLTRSTPVALENGTTRQVLFVKPDLLVVRDSLETTCPAIWRLHSYQPRGTTVDGAGALLESAEGPVGELRIVHPPRGVELQRVERDDLNDTHVDEGGVPLPAEKRPRFRDSIVLRWDMPRETDATWVFAVKKRGAGSWRIERLDPEGRVLRLEGANGLRVTTFLDREPFEFRGEGIEFRGRVALVVEESGERRAWPIRASRLALP